jgi:hypothetical protein
MFYIWDGSIGGEYVFFDEYEEALDYLKKQHPSAGKKELGTSENNLIYGDYYTH